VNCLEAEALISAAHDGETVSDTDLAAARDHCTECEECTAFAAGLRYLDVMPVEPAPAGLIERVMDAVAPLAVERAALRQYEAERAEAESVGMESPTPEPAAVSDETVVPHIVPAAETPTKPAGRFSWFHGPVRWATYGAAAAFAATAVIAFAIIGLGGGNQARTAGGTSTNQASGSLDLGFSGSGQAAGTPASPASPATTPAPAQAPDYVVYKTFVYSPGALVADASSATPTIGTVSTAFAAGGAVQSVPVYRSPLSDGSIVVRDPDGLRLYTPVIRMLASVRYQLTSGKTIDRFGVWPVLPDRFPTPTNSAGTPAFVTAGTDALGVGVFSATGRPVSEGFAVAPGTAASDPAAGNPNWTWWAPAPATP
jgi:hypothetical protein